MKFIRALAVLVIIISILVILVNCFSLYIAGFVRECDRIKITDDNRETIVALVEETIASLIEEGNTSSNDVTYYEKMPDLKQAKEVERYVGFRRNEISVYYEDGTSYGFWVEKSDEGPLSLLIQEEGYNVYFRSEEFVEDLIKILIPLMLVALLVFLLR